VLPEEPSRLAAPILVEIRRSRPLPTAPGSRRRSASRPRARTAAIEPAITRGSKQSWLTMFVASGALSNIAPIVVSSLMKAWLVLADEPNGDTQRVRVVAARPARACSARSGAPFSPSTKGKSSLRSAPRVVVASFGTGAVVLRSDRS